jgi:hypothetical protein
LLLFLSDVLSISLLFKTVLFTIHNTMGVSVVWVWKLAFHTDGLTKDDEAREQAVRESTMYLNLSRRYYNSGRRYVMESAMICIRHQKFFR